MKLLASNNYIVCRPYKLKEENNCLIVSNGNSDCFAQIFSCQPNTGFQEGEIIWYDKAFVRECSIAGEKFIAIDKSNVISTVKGV